MPRCIPAIVLCLVPALAGADPAGSASPTPSEIAEAVRRLGDASFGVREEASLFLWSAKLAALPALEEALAADDPEVVSRARRVLDRSRFGIFPETPENVARLAAQYRDGDAALRRQVVLNLIGAGRDAFPTLLALGQTEADPGLREYLSERIRQNARQFVPQFLLAGDYAEAERMLELGAASDEGMRDLAAYELLRGRLDERIAALRKQLAAGGAGGNAPRSAERADLRRRLVWSLRTKGETVAALDAARPLDDAKLLESLLYEAGRWQELAERLEKVQPKDVEQLGHLAACHRLAGNASGWDAAAQALIDHAARNSDDLQQCAKALFINDRPEEAIALLQRSFKEMKYNNRWLAFDHLCTQGRYREALEFARQYLETTDDGEFPLELRMAEVLHDLGEAGPSGEIVERLAERARTRKNPIELGQLAGVQRKLRQPGPARRFAAEALAVLDNPTRSADVLRHLFPDHTELAAICWPIVREIDGEAPAEKSLANLEKLLAGPESPEFDPALFAKLVERGTAQVASAPDAKQAEWQERLSELYALHGRNDEARQALLQATKTVPTPARQLRLGHDRADAEQWEDAARWYAAASDGDPANPIPQYLRGWALERLGRVAEGRTLQDQAELLLRSDEKRRNELVQELKGRGLTEAVARQQELIVRTGPFDSLTVSNTHGQIGNSLSGKDNLRTAESWERSLLPCLRRGTFLSDNAGLLTVPHLIHKARGRGLLQAGRAEEALVEFEAGRRFTPAEIELPLSIVPELERAGRHEDAEELFQKVYEANDRICRDWPNSARFRNQTAWLAVTTNRRLDDALRHAEKAVELEPESAAYIDTLAEVRFARGEREEALRLMQRCVELEPRTEHYRRQLERFRNTD
ncbi:MAG: hypothetical protein WD069_00160 [Planctomycetales bacterium]